MDFFIENERKRNASRIGSLVARVPVFGRLPNDASERQILEAMRGLVRLSSEAHASGPLSSVLRQDSTVRAAASRAEHAIEKELEKLIPLLVTEEGLRQGFDILRGHFPRLAQRIERRGHELRHQKSLVKKDESV